MDSIIPSKYAPALNNYPIVDRFTASLASPMTRFANSTVKDGLDPIAAGDQNTIQLVIRPYLVIKGVSEYVRSDNGIVALTK